ncbi:hypothetical protein HY29_00755 [Hyphomonas beringensis]|uniref:Uncharacterized protein n=1 Tax=Hyphomonas beringensis TaxID=1280946 RepID=A0A062UAA1_9PROT|nr:hypothetical protein HY29_00755 [Hyphomonas beringensis]
MNGRKIVQLFLLVVIIGLRRSLRDRAVAFICDRILFPLHREVRTCGQGAPFGQSHTLQIGPALRPDLVGEIVLLLMAFRAGRLADDAAEGDQASRL